MTNEQMQKVIDAIQGIDTKIKKYSQFVFGRFDEMHAPITVREKAVVNGDYLHQYCDNDGDIVDSRTVCDVLNEVCGVLKMIDEFEAEEEKPLPCPFCGREINMSMSNCAILCVCGYSSPIDRNLPKVIAAHNRVARKCKDESLRDAERCIEDVANVLSKASPGDSISYAKSAIKIVRRYCKEKKVEVKE